MDNDKIAFSSNWDIDQIVDEGTFSLSVPIVTPTTHTVDHTLGRRPFVLAQYSVDGGVTWMEQGGLGAPPPSFCKLETEVTTTQFKFTFIADDAIGVNARYWVFSDGRL